MLDIIRLPFKRARSITSRSLTKSSISRVMANNILERSDSLLTRNVEEKRPHNLKYTITDVLTAFEQKGWKLLESNYIRNSIPMRVLCSNGHEHKISFNRFMGGVGCPRCSGNSKPTIEQVKKAFKEKCWNLLEEEYINSSTQMRFNCDKGHSHTISWNHFRRGIACGKCKPRRKALTTNEVSELFKSKGWIFLSKKYVSSRTPVKFKCNNGHIGSTRIKSLRNGLRCLQCGGRARLTFEHVKEEFNKKGWTLLENEYINARTSMRARCNKGHERIVKYQNFQNKATCNKCAKHGFDVLKTACFYYIKFIFKKRSYYKIGITNRTIRQRFKDEKTPYKVVYQQQYEIGQDAYEREQKLLKRFKDSLLDPSNYFLRDGNTEVFTWDVLGLDK